MIKLKTKSILKMFESILDALKILQFMVQTLRNAKKRKQELNVLEEETRNLW